MTILLNLVKRVREGKTLEMNRGAAGVYSRLEDTG